MSKAVQEMFRRISSRYDVTNDILSLGIHRSWKKLICKRARLKNSLYALDICTGTGEVALKLNDKFPGRVLALDFVGEMLQNAIKKGSNISYLLGDAQKLPFPSQSLGLATISFGIRNLDDPTAGLKEIYRVLAPDSQLLVLEFGEERASWFNLIYRPYSKYIIPFLGGRLTGDRGAYEYLPETSAKFPARESFLKLMREAGFRDCSWTELSFGVAYLYEGVK